MGVLRDFYLAERGVDVTDAPLIVHWTTEMPAGYLGQTWHTVETGCSTWIVADALFAYPRLLPHEVGHCVRWMLTGEGDAAHADPAWWSDGGLVDRAFSALARETRQW